MSSRTKLPIRYERRFWIQLYWPGHGLLLLRSFDANALPQRVDILFHDVRWMVLPAWFEGLCIEQSTVSDIPVPLTPKIKEEIRFMSVFRITSQDVAQWLIAGEGVQVAEDSGEPVGNSQLLPDFHLRALSAFDEKTG